MREDDKAQNLLYEVNHPISRGYSGGPLLTVEGLAIGTVHAEKNEQIGYYEPLFLDNKILLHLKHLSLPLTLQNATDMMFKGSAEQKVAAALTVGPIRNVSLATLYYKLLASADVQSRKTSVTELLRCPVIKMLRDRRLDAFAEGLEVFVLPQNGITDVYDGRVNQ